MVEWACDRTCSVAATEKNEAEEVLRKLDAKKAEYHLQVHKTVVEHTRQ